MYSTALHASFEIGLCLLNYLVLELWRIQIRVRKKKKKKKEIMCVIEAKLLGRQVIKCSQKPISCPLLSGGVLFYFL